MPMVNAAIFDPQTGQVTATMMGSIDMLRNTSWVEIPVGVDIREPSAWSVDLGTMELVLSDLNPIKDSAITEVNQIIGNIRKRFITDIPGQEMIYKTKESQAKEYLSANPEPSDLTGFRLLATEVSIRGITPYEAAQLIINLASIWEDVGGALEDIRLGSIMQIEAANNASDIQAIVNDVLQQISAGIG